LHGKAETGFLHSIESNKRLLSADIIFNILSVRAGYFSLLKCRAKYTKKNLLNDFNKSFGL